MDPYLEEWLKGEDPAKEKERLRNTQRELLMDPELEAMTRETWAREDARRADSRDLEAGLEEMLADTEKKSSGKKSPHEKRMDAQERRRKAAERLGRPTEDYLGNLLSAPLTVLERAGQKLGQREGVDAAAEESIFDPLKEALRGRDISGRREAIWEDIRKFVPEAGRVGEALAHGSGTAPLWSWLGDGDVTRGLVETFGDPLNLVGAETLGLVGKATKLEQGAMSLARNAGGVAGDIWKARGVGRRVAADLASREAMPRMELMSGAEYLPDKLLEAERAWEPRPGVPAEPEPFWKGRGEAPGGPGIEVPSLNEHGVELPPYVKSYRRQGGAPLPIYSPEVEAARGGVKVKVVPSYGTTKGRYSGREVIQGWEEAERAIAVPEMKRKAEMRTAYDWLEKQQREGEALAKTDMVTPEPVRMAEPKPGEVHPGAEPVEKPLELEPKAAERELVPEPTAPEEPTRFEPEGAEMKPVEKPFKLKVETTQNPGGKSRRAENYPKGSKYWGKGTAADAAAAEEKRSELNRFFGGDEAVDRLKAQEGPVGTGKPLTGPVGKETIAFHPEDNRKTFRFRYRLAELGDLTPSHTDLLTENPAYPKIEGLQPRDRKSVATLAQLEEIQRKFQPLKYVGETSTLQHGAPIVKDSAVISGNARTLALRKILREEPLKFAEYRKALEARAAEIGFTPEQLAGMKHPVLVREMIDEVNMPEFARLANQDEIQRLSLAEQARVDAARLPNEALGKLEFEGDVTFDKAMEKASSRPLLDEFAKALPSNMKNEIFNNEGKLTSMGEQRLKAAMFSKVYNSPAGERLLKSLIESPQEGMAKFGDGLVQSLPAMGQVEELVRTGARPAQLSIVEDLAQAVDVMSRLKREGRKVQEYLDQKPIWNLEPELTAAQRDLLRNLEEMKSAKQVREFVQEYAKEVVASGTVKQSTMFGAEPVTKHGLMRKAWGCGA